MIFKSFENVKWNKRAFKCVIFCVGFLPFILTIICHLGVDDSSRFFGELSSRIRGVDISVFFIFLAVIGFLGQGGMFKNYHAVFSLALLKSAVFMTWLCCSLFFVEKGKEGGLGFFADWVVFVFVSCSLMYIWVGFNLIIMMLEEKVIETFEAREE